MNTLFLTRKFQVRNCSSIEKSIRETLINRVFNRLLEGEEKGEV